MKHLDDIDLLPAPTLAFDALGRRRWVFADGRTAPYISGGSDGGTTTVTDPPATGDPAPPADPPDDGTTDWKAKHDTLLAQSRKWEERAKANKDAADRLKKFEEQHATDEEKAVKAAREEGFNEARNATGAKLVRAELRTQAAEAGLPLSAVDSIMEYLDVSKLLTDEGDADEEKIKAIVSARKATAGAGGKDEKKKTTDLGQGPRDAAAQSGTEQGLAAAATRYGNRARSASSEGAK